MHQSTPDSWRTSRVLRLVWQNYRKSGTISTTQVRLSIGRGRSRKIMPTVSLGINWNGGKTMKTGSLTLPRWLGGLWLSWNSYSYTVSKDGLLSPATSGNSELERQGSGTNSLAAGRR
jgi:hypothetical protein